MSWNRKVSSSLGGIWPSLEGNVSGICDWMWVVKDEGRRKKMLRPGSWAAGQADISPLRWGGGVVLVGGRRWRRPGVGLGEGGHPAHPCIKQGHIRLMQPGKTQQASVRFRQFMT